MKKLFYNFPYLIPFGAGIFIFVVSFGFKEPYKDLLINIGASLITIPIVIFTYERVQERSIANKNKDVSDYVKMNLDRELITILNQVSSLVFGEFRPGLTKVIKLLSLDKKGMEKVLEDHSTLVFYLATDWACAEERLALLLSNELIYQNLSVEERNAFIRLMQALRSLEYTTNPRYYMVIGQPDTKLSVVKGSEIDPTTKLDERYLLMRQIGKKNRSVVVSFNDINISKYKVDLLIPMKSNKDGNRLLSKVLTEILDCINVWLEARGREFILDDRNFRAQKLG